MLLPKIVWLIIVMTIYGTSTVSAVLNQDELSKLQSVVHKSETIAETDTHIIHVLTVNKTSKGSPESSSVFQNVTRYSKDGGDVHQALARLLSMLRRESTSHVTTVGYEGSSHDGSSTDGGEHRTDTSHEGAHDDLTTPDGGEHRTDTSHESAHDDVTTPGDHTDPSAAANKKSNGGQKRKKVRKGRRKVRRKGTKRVKASKKPKSHYTGGSTHGKGTGTKRPRRRKVRKKVKGAVKRHSTTTARHYQDHSTTTVSDPEGHSTATVSHTKRYSTTIVSDPDGHSTATVSQPGSHPTASASEPDDLSTPITSQTTRHSRTITHPAHGRMAGAIRMPETSLPVSLTTASVLQSTPSPSQTQLDIHSLATETTADDEISNGAEDGTMTVTKNVAPLRRQGVGVADLRNTDSPLALTAPSPLAVCTLNHDHRIDKLLSKYGAVDKNGRYKIGPTKFVSLLAALASVEDTDDATLSTTEEDSTAALYLNEPKLRSTSANIPADGTVAVGATNPAVVDQIVSQTELPLVPLTEPTVTPTVKDDLTTLAPITMDGPSVTVQQLTEDQLSPQKYTKAAEQILSTNHFFTTADGLGPHVTVDHNEHIPAHQMSALTKDTHRVNKGKPGHMAGRFAGGIHSPHSKTKGSHAAPKGRGSHTKTHPKGNAHHPSPHGGSASSHGGNHKAPKAAPHGKGHTKPKHAKARKPQGKAAGGSHGKKGHTAVRTHQPTSHSSATSHSSHDSSTLHESTHTTAQSTTHGTAGAIQGRDGAVRGRFAMGIQPNPQPSTTANPILFEDSSTPPPSSTNGENENALHSSQTLLVKQPATDKPLQLPTTEMTPIEYPMNPGVVARDNFSTTNPLFRRPESVITVPPEVLDALGDVIYEDDDTAHLHPPPTHKPTTVKHRGRISTTTTLHANQVIPKITSSKLHAIENSGQPRSDENDVSDEQKGKLGGRFAQEIKKVSALRTSSGRPPVNGLNQVGTPADQAENPKHQALPLYFTFFEEQNSQIGQPGDAPGETPTSKPGAFYGAITEAAESSHAYGTKHPGAIGSKSRGKGGISLAASDSEEGSSHLKGKGRVKMSGKGTKPKSKHKIALAHTPKHRPTSAHKGTDSEGSYSDEGSNPKGRGKGATSGRLAGRTKKPPSHQSNPMHHKPKKHPTGESGETTDSHSDEGPSDSKARGKGTTSGRFAGGIKHSSQQSSTMGQSQTKPHTGTDTEASGSHSYEVSNPKGKGAMSGQFAMGIKHPKHHPGSSEADTGGSHSDEGSNPRGRGKGAMSGRFAGGIKSPSQHTEHAGSHSDEGASEFKGRGAMSPFRKFNPPPPQSNPTQHSQKKYPTTPTADLGGSVSHNDEGPNDPKAHKGTGTTGVMGVTPKSQQSTSAQKTQAAHTSSSPLFEDEEIKIVMEPPQGIDEEPSEPTWQTKPTVPGEAQTTLPAPPYQTFSHHNTDEAPDSNQIGEGAKEASALSLASVLNRLSMQNFGKQTKVTVRKYNGNRIQDAVEIGRGKAKQYAIFSVRLPGRKITHIVVPRRLAKYLQATIKRRKWRLRPRKNRRIVYA